MEFKELEPASWHYFEQLMGDKGGCGGCWCMFYRLPAEVFKEQKYEGNKEAMHALVKQRKPIGLLALVEGEPIG